MAKIFLIDPTNGRREVTLPDNNGCTLDRLLVFINGNYNRATTFYRMDTDGRQVQITRDTIVRDNDVVTAVSPAKAG